MDGTWQIVKWVWVGVCLVWLAVQMLAIRRLKGDLKRRSMNVLWVVLVLMNVSDWIREVFENPTANRIGMLVVVAATIIAAILPLGVLRSPDARKDTDAPDVDAEGGIQRLKLG